MFFINLESLTKHHFEPSGGINFFVDDGLDNPLPFAFTIGYRYQKPQSNFIFRTGIASPDGVYLGIGVAF